MAVDQAKDPSQQVPAHADERAFAEVPGDAGAAKGVQPSGVFRAESDEGPASSDVFGSGRKVAGALR
jgi:hypothetical protein